MPTLSKNPPIDCAYDSLLAVVLPHVSFSTSVPVGFGPEMYKSKLAICKCFS